MYKWIKTQNKDQNILNIPMILISNRESHGGAICYKHMLNN